MGKNNFYQNFLDPADEYRPAAYWFWQQLPTKQEIRTQLKEILESGFHTFFIQPRLAYPIEQYLDEDYLSAYQYAIQYANALGLRAGIYDDYNWNSGHAGGLTVKGHDEFRERQLFWTSAIIKENVFQLEISDIDSLMGDKLGSQQAHWTYEGGKPLWSDWELIKVVAYPPNENITPESTLINLKTFCSIEVSGDKSSVIKVHLPTDAYQNLKITVFVAARCITSRHINYLNKKATTHFIEVGYEPYKKAVGDYFGSTVFCMFMDHPHAGFYSWKQAEGNILNSLMYDESLLETFHLEHKYPIENSWVSFLLPTSQFSSKLRSDFFKTYGRIAQEYFLGQISGWAHENGLLFAGHELFGFLGIWGFYGGYHTIDQRTDFGGDYFGIGAYKDISTVDAYNSNPQISAKVGDSVARAKGDHGCMLEQYYFCTDPEFPGAIGQWNLTYEEMRAQAIRQTIFGTKQFIFHGYYLSDSVGGHELLASSRFDFAPGINFEPWFRHHASFAEELSRLSAFIYGAEPNTEIAVLFPLSSYQVEGSEGVLGEESGVWHQELLESGIGFDIVNEQQLHFDDAFPGHIMFGNNRYKILILPGASTLENLGRAGEISHFVESGGLLLISGKVPHATIEDGQNPIVENILLDLIKYQKNAIYFPNAEESRRRLIPLLNSVQVNLPKVIEPEQQSGQIWSWVGKEDSSDLFALFNDSAERTRATLVVPAYGGVPEKWDLKTGEKRKWLWHKETNEALNIFVDLEPQEIACFRIDLEERIPEGRRLIESELPVLCASKEQDKETISTLGEREGKYTITKIENGKQINQTIQVPSMPAPLILEGNWEFRIATEKEMAPVNINEGWERQGFKDYVGEGIYQTEFDMELGSNNWEKWDWRLDFPKISSTSEIILNEVQIGNLLWTPYRIILPSPILKPTGNKLVVKVFNTGGNYYYAGSPYQVGKYPSGIIGAPMINPIKIITVD